MFGLVDFKPSDKSFTLNVCCSKNLNVTNAYLFFSCVEQFRNLIQTILKQNMWFDNETANLIDFFSNKSS